MKTARPKPRLMRQNLVEQVAPIVENIKPLLAGKSPALQGMVLCDCLAIWLAGHHVEGDEDATSKMRAELLANHCAQVRQLVQINAYVLGTTLGIP